MNQHSALTRTRGKDVAEAYRNTKTFSFEVFVQHMMRTTGCSNEVVDKIELHVHQLYPGKDLAYLGERFNSYFDRYLSLEAIKSERSYAIPNQDGSVSVPLKVWVSDFLIRGGQRAYFGDFLEEIDPNISWAFLEFDDLSWQILYQYPKVLSKKMHAAKERVTEALRKYFETPITERSGDAWFTKAMENEMRDLDLDTRDISIMMQTIYWGINTNTRRGCFWMLTYMLFHPEVIPLVMQETEKASTEGNTTPDIDYLNDQCPWTNSVWNETLRMSAASSSVRYITADTVLHFDEKIFGDRVTEFDPKRFYDNPALLKSPSWRPFGGGATMCPGRFVVKQAVVNFIAMALNRFDISIDGPQPMPTAKEGNPVIGLMSNQPGSDLRVRLRLRKY
ncbi:cytochrome P450 [Melanomma pulvis-pyrius CBS 109.77]|uniref:Cytochrome P450 n=1 Tax=Melanomma pulvis-pyrius CBS 109.77 TaxID=1314802 RepID=A0A6A6XHP7_9PLEO|nr:cytochrome P450 [Melanomma pulvis-pyrius CBS 109.77]